MTKHTIAIGALGGSGTRAVAEIFIQLGIFLGDNINNSNDNLLFTRLFKNPDWYRLSSLNEKNVRFDLFERYMSGKHLSDIDIELIHSAVKNNPPFRKSHIRYQSRFKRLYEERKLLYSWGWKEPNTQLYANEILSFNSKVKYIHVIRHGLDMAFSTNINQLKNWGWKYNIKFIKGESDQKIACKQLDYWISSTQEILKLKETYDDRILILDHSKFCNKPVETIETLLDFCEITTTQSKFDELVKIPKNTGSNNRYKVHDLSIFTDYQLAKVKEFGFEI